jgi:hypothetical protein
MSRQLCLQQKGKVTDMPNSVTTSDAGANEPEIEITPERIIQRRPRCCDHVTLLEIANRFSNVRIPFDDEDTSATSAYISAWPRWQRPSGRLCGARLKGGTKDNTFGKIEAIEYFPRKMSRNEARRVDEFADPAPPDVRNHFYVARKKVSKIGSVLGNDFGDPAIEFLLVVHPLWRNDLQLPCVGIRAVYPHSKSR